MPTQRVPAAAAKCIVPVSLPRYSAQRLNAAAEPRGLNLPAAL
jgi:hypothetical protein